ncbi:U3 small nucleolar RNA-associated 20 [Hyphodiscus hymeniophilus]|uniref:U3 small nucleolar RNA-associated 20 n=1 Tax=Hyphodiscus hymeniophilus TaxID=353542 RepID=A0A9P6VME8_9HELO|nr:U3 small nucleolar RNA-associated 20 [Hyphodiscus hymeniophilus]
MPTSSGRIVKVRQVKTGTLHQKNHRWESFTIKISKLSSLDPIRRVRRHDIDAEDLSTSTSYLKAGLEKWQELNMSGNFIEFSHDILPLCDSLPQIIHFEDRIMELMVTHIEKKERESLEPLLDLMTDFAHDLGTRFEKHYAKALEMVTSLAGMLQDVEVIEWSFTCLAFMFKYLSRLLVPDLRPTYDLMAPLLGKHRQQTHIARFAAEAMSFLIKKAGAPANREKALPLIIRHAKLDLHSIAGTRQFGLYYHGVMTMFAEAMKGNGMSIHTSGPAIFQSLIHGLDEVDLQWRGSPWMDVISGVLTSMIHHTSCDTFKDILEVVVERANAAVACCTESPTEWNLRRLLLSARTIGLVAGVRKGSRADTYWPAILRTQYEILQIVSKNAVAVAQFDQDLTLWNSLILSVSITIQYSPMDALIPFISKYMDALTKEPLAKWFLAFCWYLSQIGPERFQSVALQPFQRFVVAHWSEDNGDTLCVMLPKMVSAGVLPSNYGKDGFTLPQSWQDQIVSKFERLEVQPFPEQAALYDRSPKTWHDRCLPKYNALLEVLGCTKVHPSTSARLAEILLRKLKLALRPSSSLAAEEAHFIVGRGFTAFSSMIRGVGEPDKALEPLLRAAAPRYARLPNFLEALLAYEKSLRRSPTPASPKKPVATLSQEDDAKDNLLMRSLVENLSTDSTELRLLTLRLLEHFYVIETGSHSDVLSIMIMVEQTPLDLTTARSASMHIRKLATLYPHQTVIPWLKPTIPAFCFGMLNVKFSQIWEDASASLKQIAESKDGEEAVANLAFGWLETPSAAWNGSARSIEQSHNNGLTDFECSNMIKLDQLAKTAESEVVKVRDTMLESFDMAQQLVAAQPLTARAQALRVLTAAPALAEKRSRQLVPMFLSWAGKGAEEIDDDSEAVLSDWTRKDQKALLDLFGLFTNPRSLYKSEEVHEALLGLLGNGDIEIQKSAIKAIFTWKNKSIRPYEENLLNLLDEARFKDEITILLQGQTLVQAEHRSDLMPILLRVLYGRAISRKGAASGRQGMEARRLTVLRNLGLQDVENFLEIALGDLKNIELIKDGQLNVSLIESEVMNTRKQVGFTNMIEVVLKELGTKVTPFTQKLVHAVLYCVIRSSRMLQNELDDSEEDAGANQSTQTSLLKVIRQTGLKCLNLLFTNSESFNWNGYVEIIVREIVQPRVDNLPIETAQGISGILRLFYTWSTAAELVTFFGAHDQILPKVAECLAPQKSKDEVKSFALNIIRNIVKLSNGSSTSKELLLKNIDEFLIQIGGILRNQQDLSKKLLEDCVETVSELAPVVQTSTQARNLVDVSIFLLDQPSRRVNPRTKSGLLKILQHFVPLHDLQDDAGLRDRLYNTVTSLFGFFKDKVSREVLSQVLMVYSQKDPVIGEVAALCLDVNSFVEGRLDEPDYTRRLTAFNAINTRTISFNARQWTALLYNMLYYIRNDEEYAVLALNSADGVCRFITAASNADDTEKPGFQTLLLDVLLPALFSGAREPSEVIRQQYLKVMGHLIRTFPDWPEVGGMQGLLAGEDEIESSFFNNIVTLGKGKQSAALKQVSAAAENGELSGKMVSHFFIPLVEHFIFDRAEGSDAHNLAAEATSTVGILSGSLEWPQYRAMLRRYIGYIAGKPDLEKQIIRLLGRVIDALASAVDESSRPLVGSKRSTLVATIPKQQKLSEDLSSNVLPPLTSYLHDKDESTVSLRVPVAVIVVRILKLLPPEQLNERLPAVLTDVCHILRSKAQEARDMTRVTLVKICLLLGPSCFGFVLKELRGALARGPQLHVLSFTMHSILVETIPEYAPGDLDYCLPTIVAIIMDDIFGHTGQEKDAKADGEYTSKMKEIKNSKSYDSMELIAQTATLYRLTDLVKPVQGLLNEKLNRNMVGKIDNLLSRISNGLLKNSAASTRDSLVFCFEVIQDVYASAKPKEKTRMDPKLKKYIIQKGAKRAGERGSTSVYTYKLLRFAFDVMRSVLAKYDELRTSQNLAGFVPIFESAVNQGEEEVQVAAFKVLTAVVNVPLKAAGDAAADGTHLYQAATAEAVKVLRNRSKDPTDSSHAALKLLTAVLREREDVPVKDTAIDAILAKLNEDFDEPDRRDITYKFLKVILTNGVQTVGVYDILDHVREVMVTNSDEGTRKLARGAYIQFLLEYPQKGKRWRDQLKFIEGNLEYQFEGGRLSTLDVVNSLLRKASDDHVQKICETLFKPLMGVLANDESDKCREWAGELFKSIFGKANIECMGNFMTTTRSFVKNVDSPGQLKTGFQLYRFYYEARSSDDSDLDILRQSILDTLNRTNDAGIEWDVIYAAIQLTQTLVEKFPEAILSSISAAMWKAITKCISYPYQWVKFSAIQLTRTYFEALARNGMQGLPLTNDHGLKLTGDDIIELLRRCLHIFRTPELQQYLADAVLPLLTYLGVCVGVNDLAIQKAVDSDDEGDDEEERADQRSALQYLFARLSYFLRRESSPPRATVLIPKTAALELLGILTSKLPESAVTSCLPTILLPLQHLTDKDIPIPYSTDELFRANYAALQSTSSEIIETLQKKVGTQTFTEMALKVGKQRKERRMQRSVKRKVDAVAHPERSGAVKRKKVVRKKERRKEKGEEHRRQRHEQ